MLKVIEAEQVMKEKSRILLSAKGIGPTKIVNLIAGLPELRILNRQQIAKLPSFATAASSTGKEEGMSRLLLKLSMVSLS